MQRLALAAIAVVTTTLAPLSGANQPNPFLGQWAMTGTGDDASLVYWLEITESAGQLSGMFLDRVGNPNPLAVVKIENGELVFSQAGRGGAPGQEYRARIENGRLVGRHTMVLRGRRGGDPTATPTERVVNWVGVRPPSWPPFSANGKHVFGAPVALFNGTTLEPWGVQHAERPMNWAIEDGTMTNAERANNLVSKQKFMNFKIEAEYKLGPGSNSGIYLRGRYELQLLDDATDTRTRRDLAHMAIYGRVAPSVNASKPAGEWQSMSAVLVGNRVTVVLNGTTVHNDVAIAGITGGALDNAETTPGPIMIQGDHSKVWVRKVVVTPITEVR
jgi:hypothetical protein